MTRFDVLVSEGPKGIALLVARSKFEAIKKTCEKFGVEYEISEKALNDLVEDHYEYLVSECEEATN